MAGVNRCLSDGIKADLVMDLMWMTPQGGDEVEEELFEGHNRELSFVTVEKNRMTSRFLRRADRLRGTWMVALVLR